MEGRPFKLLSQTITRPADTTAYASGDLVANSTTAGSVTPFRFTGAARNVGAKTEIMRASLQVSQALLANGTFRLHLFSKAPTVTGGDNAALDVASNLAAYIGWFEIALSIIGTGQGAYGVSSPVATGAAGHAVRYDTANADLWGLLEARAAYVPTSAMTLTAGISGKQW